MNSRKIQLVGNRSYAISLPIDWVKSNNLKEKDEVSVTITDNNELLVSKTAHGKKSGNSLTVNIDSAENIAEFIIFCYSKGINSLKISFKNNDYQKIRRIRATLKFLDGYEITDENEKAVEISFLFNDIEIQIDKIFPRMVYLLRLMVNSLEKKDMASLEDAETTIDKLYHLSTKILFESIKNYKIRKENSIHHYEDIFYLKDIAKRLENIGDIIYQFGAGRASAGDLKILKKSVEFCNQLLIKKEPLYRKLLAKLESEASKRQTNYLIHRIYHLCKDLAENISSIEYNKKFFSAEI